MFKKHLSFLSCPSCNNNFILETEETSEIVSKGKLRCVECSEIFIIRGGIPRFIADQGYVGDFGLQWRLHSRTQYDSASGLRISEKRLFKETNWPRNMAGEKILEVGCGAGRFTEQLLKTEATIVSFDMSAGVEENYEAHGKNDRVLIIQANVYNLPLRNNYFDRIMCFGVLQYTPDSKKTLLTIYRHLRSGGNLVADIYLKHPWWRQMWNTRYWIRPITKRMNPNVLYRLCRAYVYTLWPVVKIIHYFPYGKSINHKLLIPELIDGYNLTEEQHKEWALIHLFGWLSPYYDNPQNIDTMKEWIKEVKPSEFSVNIGYGGIEVRVKK